MLTQEEIKEKETKLYNKNKNYQLLIQTVLFSLLVYILFSPVCVSLVNKFNKRKIDLGITHWDVCLNSKSCQSVLNRRGASVHFLIDFW